MKLFSTKKDQHAFTKVLSAFFVNLSAGWFAVIFIAPNYWPIKSPLQVFSLTYDLILAIFCMWLAYKLERKSR